MNLFNKTPPARAGIPHGPSDMICPYHKRAMSEVCHACPKWVKVQGMNPQDSTKHIDQWNCADAFAVPLMIELGRQMLSNAAAIENLTKEHMKTDVQSQTMINTLLTVVNRAISQPQVMPSLAGSFEPFKQVSNGHLDEPKRLE